MLHIHHVCAQTSILYLIWYFVIVAVKTPFYTLALRMNHGIITTSIIKVLLIQHGLYSYLLMHAGEPTASFWGIKASDSPRAVWKEIAS